MHALQVTRQQYPEEFVEAQETLYNAVMFVFQSMLLFFYYISNAMCLASRASGGRDVVVNAQDSLLAAEASNAFAKAFGKRRAERES